MSDKYKGGASLEDLKVITAANIINLRTKAGYTQAELGEMLCYSDKSISKWERAEAIPDAYVLKRMGEIFGVSVDYLLKSHDEWKQVSEREEKRRYRTGIVTTIAIAGIWTVALFIFIVCWILDIMAWIVFLYAVPVSLATLLTLNSLWEDGKHNRLIIAMLIFSIIMVIYFTFLLFGYNIWQIFLLLIPAELILFLSFHVKKPLD